MHIDTIPFKEWLLAAEYLLISGTGVFEVAIGKLELCSVWTGFMRFKFSTAGVNLRLQLCLASVHFME